MGGDDITTFCLQEGCKSDFKVGIGSQAYLRVL